MCLCEICGPFLPGVCVEGETSRPRKGGKGEQACGLGRKTRKGATKHVKHNKWQIETSCGASSSSSSSSWAWFVFLPFSLWVGLSFRLSLALCFRPCPFFLRLLLAICVDLNTIHTRPERDDHSVSSPPSLSFSRFQPRHFPKQPINIHINQNPHHTHTTQNLHDPGTPRTQTITTTIPPTTHSQLHPYVFAPFSS